MILEMRPLNVRLAVAYMATAGHAVEPGKQTFTNCDPGSTLDRLNHEGSHPYSAMWRKIDTFYTRQGWDKLCDAEVLQLQTAAMGVGFTTKAGHKVVPQFVHKAVKQWADTGWFRYEHQRSGRRKMFAKVGLIGLAVFGIPVATA